MSERELHVVLYGATGFTGRLAAEYLAAHAPAGTRWAIAGRNPEALATVRAEIAAARLPCPPGDVVLAGADDDRALTALARRTRVVLTTVGPYAKHGEPLVRACVEGGASYADITGEPAFVARVRARYDEAARAKRLRLVSCCGFDSVPHDLGAWFTVQHLPESVPLAVDGFVQASGRYSGGTWASAVNAFATLRDQARDRAAARAERPAETGGRRARAEATPLRWVKELGAWGCALPTIDPEIVVRSARAIPRYGPDFRYGHYARVRHLSTVAGAAAFLGGVVALAQVPATRALLLRALPSGEGPSPEQRAKARFRVTFLGEGGGARIATEVSGGDAGYTETAKMASEAALALAFDEARLPARFGALTPAAAFEGVLVERLERAGIRFRVVPPPGSPAA